ncbi:MAG: c-type cytochrome [Sulfurovum sp.]|uniref:c-type cytochrome n=1 Tax=Sulfurovum sp. TaxID=1969726 RepID=UPI002867FD0D|nr:c-type cytochrome [Sulfurovum sp.]MCO4845340.1 c-type cytochrome [Sulfurovum sp.]
MKKTLLLLLLTGTMMFASSGAELTKTNCASCHMLTTPTPDMISTMKAPAMDAVMFHINLAIQNKKEVKGFIVDYVQHPDASKSVCESHKVQKFGVMPSLKGKVSEQDLDAIAEHMIATYPSKEFVVMIKEIQKNDKMHSLINSPFLLNKEELPHLTKLLLHNWDKAALGLTDEQKEKLLVVRHETLSAIKEIKEKVQVLEAEIIEAMVDGETLEKMYPKLEAVAKLKVEATKVQLKCLKKSMEILNDDQIEFLLPFWDA